MTSAAPAATRSSFRTCSSSPLARRRSGRVGDSSGTGYGRGRKVAPMTSTIGQILPVAAQRFGARTALLVGDRSFSFDDLQALSNRAANGLVAAGVAAGRPRRALRPELLGVARRLLRHRQDRRGRDPGQRHAHARRGPLRRRGLRDAGRGRIGGQGRAAARSARHREPPGRRAVGRRRPGRGDRVRRLARARVAGVQPGPAGRRRPGGHLLHVGDDRAARRARCNRTAP